MANPLPRSMIDRDRSVLVIVDVQEKLLPAVNAPHDLLQNILGLLHAANALSVPVVITEHCADAIGPTVGEILERAGDAILMQKTHFCVTAEPGAAARFRDLRRDQAIVVGTEAHVCVLQSAFGLLDNGHQVFLVPDAVSSRRSDDKDRALERFVASQGQVATTEMVIFEWLREGGTAAFRSLLPIIKSLKG